MEKDKVREILNNLAKLNGYESDDNRQEKIDFAHSEIQKLMLGEQEMKSELLAQNRIFFDFEEARISIGKCRELIAKALYKAQSEKLNGNK